MHPPPVLSVAHLQVGATGRGARQRCVVQTIEVVVVEVLGKAQIVFLALRYITHGIMQIALILQRHTPADTCGDGTHPEGRRVKTMSYHYPIAEGLLCQLSGGRRSRSLSIA